MAKVCIDSRVLTANLDAVLRDVGACGAVLRADVSAHVCPELRQRIAKHGISRFAVGAVPDAVTLADEDTKSVLVTRPAAAGDFDLLRMDHSPNIRLTIDHFVQAERISQAAVATGTEFSVVIDIDTGDGSTGIRPGTDACELALGANRLGGIRVTGLHTWVPRDGDVQHSTQALGHTMQLLTSADVGCDHIGISCRPNALVDAVAPVVTEISFDAFLDPRIAAPDAVTSMGVPTQPAIWIEAEVISRPSLDRAVLNIGDQLLRSRERIVWLPDLPGTRIRSCGADYCVVEVSHQAANLRIGDHVRIAPEDPTGTILRSTSPNIVWY